METPGYFTFQVQSGSILIKLVFFFPFVIDILVQAMSRERPITLIDCSNSKELKSARIKKGVPCAYSFFFN